MQTIHKGERSSWDILFVHYAQGTICCTWKVAFKMIWACTWVCVCCKN